MMMKTNSLIIGITGGLIAFALVKLHAGLALTFIVFIWLPIYLYNEEKSSRKKNKKQ